jgi:DNA-binding NtrC family response regulator
LDEIGEMPAGTQAKLLRVLEDSNVRRLGGKSDIKVEVRVIAATNRDLEAAVGAHDFREDLLYRLKVFVISLPPLRERIQDLPELMSAILTTLNKKHGCRVIDVSRDVLGSFQRYRWPGNIRELRNVLERAAIVAGEGTIETKHLPDVFRRPPEPPPAASATEQGLHVPLGTKMSDVEEAYIRMTLQRTGNNKRKAAELLGISERTLYSRLSEYEAADRKSRTHQGLPAAITLED